MDVTNGGSERLDSWKAIAAYLKRDVRTVRRWEHELALPVRRLPGGHGRSVFAYTAEIDAWLGANPPTSPQVQDDALPGEPVASNQITRRQYTAAAAAVLILGAGGAAWVSLRPPVPLSAFQVQVTDTAVIGMANGREQWRHQFTGERIDVPPERGRHPADILHTAPQAIIAATALQVGP